MMNQEDIFKKIGQILNELQDQYDFLAQNPQRLNELELELFLANANFLSDHVQIIRKINNSNLVKELSTQEESIGQQAIPQADEVVSIVEAPHLEEIEKEELQQENVHLAVGDKPAFEFLLNDNPETDRFEFEDSKSVVEIFNRPLSDQEQQIIAQKQKANEELPNEAASFLIPSQSVSLLDDPIEEKEVPPVKIETHEIDNIKEEIVRVPSNISEPRVSEILIQDMVSKPTLNDLLAAKNNSSLTFIANENVAKPSITDLKGAINLNEKLLYIKDLFNGYNLAYSEAIDLINKMPDLKTVDAFLKNNYAQKNNWETKQGTVDKFYDLLNQRFPAG